MEILLIGNTDFVTKQWIEHAFPHDKVVVALRKGTESSGEDLKIIDMPDRDAMSEVFSNYEFDRIVYFSEDRRLAANVTATWATCADCCTPSAIARSRC